jgi:outer membrane protein assembly factor BamB
MTTTMRRFLIVLLIGVLPTPSPARGSESDWPRWRGPHRDGVSRETGLLDAWPEGGPPALWRIPLGAGFSAVSVADGKAYTMYGTDTDERVVCVDAATGRILWEIRSGPLLNNEYGDGPRATPTIEEGRVYTHGATGSLCCLEADTGKTIWRFDTLERFGAENLDFGLSASPVILGKTLVVVVGGQEGKSLVAVDKTNGKVLWTSLSDKGGYSTPLPIQVNGAPQLVVLTGQAIVGVAPADGRELWRHPWITTLDANVATPILHDRHLFVASGYGTGCALFELSAAGGAAKADKRWANKNMKNYFSTCVLLDGHLYGFNNTLLTCMEFSTGEVRWRQRGFNRGSVLAADGKLIVLGERGTLALADASPEQYKEISRVEGILEAKTWTVPTLAGGRLFLRNEKELLCLRLADSAG